MEARATISSGWNEKTAANLLAALTKLAAQLKPVTAESLLNFNTKPTVRTYWIVSICLAACIVPFSVASFVSSAISQTIKADVATANELAVKLNAQLGSSVTQVPADAATAAPGAGGPTPSVASGVSPVDVVTELQTLASTIRAIDARARQLDWFIFNIVRDPYPEVRGDRTKYRSLFELPVPLPTTQLGIVGARWIQFYQDVRSFGQDVVDDVSVFYGAITTTILPVLYALLGTCAYLLRSFSQEMANRTFVRSHSDSARFLIAAIGGAVVGLFNNVTISQGASISPLALAFLVGYAVDVFFSFLEGLIQAFTKSKNSNPTQAKQA